jgi:transposase
VVSRSLPGFTVDTVRAINTTLVVEAHSHALSATCPNCFQLSTRIHSRYLRSPRDLPLSEHRVQLLVTVRRFFCDNPSCTRRTFAERFPDVLPVHAQRTARLTLSLQHLGFALGGDAGADLGAKLRFRTSPDTLLRIVRGVTPSTPTTPRVLGVDDFALQKGRVYGTILVDLERHRPIDLLPDRTAASFATWLREHPGIAIITRDRSTEYARGATEGAPEARQIVDRWHLLQNMREAVERVLNRLHAHLRHLPALQPSEQEDSHMTKPQRLRPPTATEQSNQTESRARRLERYLAVRQLVSQGVSQRAIARQLKLSRTTVRLFASAQAFPERAVRQPMKTVLDPYLPYLEQRWSEGCTNGTQLWRELQARGFWSGPRQVMRWVQYQRDTPAPTTPPKHIRPRAVQPEQSALAAPRQLVWLFLKPPQDLTRDEQARLAQLRQEPQMLRTYELAQQFVQMVRERRADALDDWLGQCKTSEVPDLQTFAATLCRDEQAIRNALQEQWSNGQVEGQVTRLKLIKRQMYGRAKFDLLRQRVLRAA